VLRVSAIGYGTQEVTVVAVRDTTKTVELYVMPVALDRLDVRGRSFRVMGGGVRLVTPRLIERPGMPPHCP
jgi:hypothetical protein